MADIVIYIRGGTFQQAISNTTDDRVVVVDYDDDPSEDARRDKTSIACDAPLVKKVFDAANPFVELNSYEA